MMQKPGLGDNRTGIGSAPERARDMQDVDDDLAMPTSGGNGRRLSKLRADYSEEAIPAGSIPRTGKDGSTVPADRAPFVDKLGARLAFERMGTRLYDGLLYKLDAFGSFDGGPSRTELAELRDQELEHFHLVHQAVIDLGGDPTAVTPSADLETTVGKGVGDVIGDPRISLLEGLEAILVAELADNASWEALCEMAQMHGHDSLAERFGSALQTEEEHLDKVKRWLAAGQGRRPTRH